MQPPPNPYPHYPQQPWQQPPMPPPQQWHPQQQWNPQQPPYPPQQYQPPPQYQPPMPPPKKKSHKRLWLILAAVILVLAVIIGVASQGQSQHPAPATQATQPTHVTQQPTLQPTSKPTPKPTVQPTKGLAATHGTPHLGGPISDFVGAYGTPDAHSTVNGVAYLLHFVPSTSPDSNVDGLIINNFGDFSHNVSGITVQAQNGIGWTVNDAQTRCMTFAPSDAHFMKEFVYANNSGFDMVYTSVELAREFPASAFTDSQQNQVQAGTFDVQYLFAGDTQHIDSCDMIIGEQQTTN